MVQDGPRLRKLKEVYKKAIQEILKEEDSIIASIAASETRDSFYSDSSALARQEDIRKVFNELKHQFSEVLKNKMREANLDLKLNSLDKDIKDGRTCCQDLRDTNYIKEIMESYAVDKKEELVRLLEEELERCVKEKQLLEKDIKGITDEFVTLEAESQGMDEEYRRIAETMESAYMESV